MPASGNFPIIMPQRSAADHFLGKNGCPRLNCASSVAEAFKDRFPLEGKTVAPLSACGGGRAPGGLCGAFFAAKSILEIYVPHRLEESLEEMRQAAGSLLCREVKSLKKLPCHHCVELAAKLLAKD